MTSINLLPWREELRAKKKRDFIRMGILFLVLGFFLVFVAYMYLSYVLDQQRAANRRVIDANTALNIQLNSLDGLQVRNEDILQRMKLIQDLQSLRPIVVHVFDELVKATPKDMYLTEFSRVENRFVIQGVARDLNVISEFLRRLDHSSWFRSAFMTSFVAAEPKAQKSGAVAPRVEDDYGEFVVTVDLADTSKLLDQSKAHIAGDSP